MSEFKVKPARGSTQNPDHIFISIKGDAKTSMTVTWRTSVDVTSGYAIVREDGKTDTVKYEATTGYFKSDIDESNMFWADMVNLKPGTKYFYTVGNDEFRSEEYFFTTEEENAESFKFMCVSDQQKGEPHDLPDYSYFTKVLKTVLEENPDIKFILTAGDNTDCGQHEVQWNGAFSGLKGVVEYIPFMMTVGNHDNRGFKDYKNHIGRYYAEPAEFFCKQFKGSYPFNGPEGWETENYSFSYGNAHFNIISVNEPERVNDWLIKDIGATDRVWKFGSYHFPMYYAGPELSNDDGYPMMREGIEMLDVLFAGHEHNFARTFPIKNEQLFDKPSQGTIHYELGNSDCNPPGTMSCHKVWHAAHYPCEEQISTVAIVEVFKDKVILTSKVVEDGRVIDQCIIDKKNDTIYPIALAPIFKRRTRTFYKGLGLGLSEREQIPEFKDGMWFSPLAVLFTAVGADVIKEEGKVTLGIYGKTATFTEGSNIAVTNDGEVTLPAPVYRGENSQLYIPLDAIIPCFNMKWNYAERNNYLSIEHVDEAIPMTKQP